MNREVVRQAPRGKPDQEKRIMDIRREDLSQGDFGLREMTAFMIRDNANRVLAHHFPSPHVNTDASFGTFWNADRSQLVSRQQFVGAEIERVIVIHQLCRGVDQWYQAD